MPPRARVSGPLTATPRSRASPYLVPIPTRVGTKRSSIASASTLWNVSPPSCATQILSLHRPWQRATWLGGLPRPSSFRTTAYVRQRRHDVDTASQNALPAATQSEGEQPRIPAPTCTPVRYRWPGAAKDPGPYKAPEVGPTASGCRPGEPESGQRGELVSGQLHAAALAVAEMRTRHPAPRPGRPRPPVADMGRRFPYRSPYRSPYQLPYRRPPEGDAGSCRSDLLTSPNRPSRQPSYLPRPVCPP